MATEFLATVLGWYLLCFGLLVLIRRERMRALVSDILAQPGLFFLLALITFVLGLLIVVTHNVWIRAWPVLITVLGWLMVIASLLRLFFMDEARGWGRAFMKEPMRITVAAVVSLIIGLFLLWKVYYAVW